MLRSSRSLTALTLNRVLGLSKNHISPKILFHNPKTLTTPLIRSFSTNPSNNNSEPNTSSSSAASNNNDQKNEIRKLDYDEYEEEIPNTPRGKVAYWSLVSFRLALIILGLGCVVLTAKELMPSRLSPQSLFSEVFEYLRYKEEVIDSLSSIRHFLSSWSCICIDH